MSELDLRLTAENKIVCAIDTSDEGKAESLVQLCRQAGAWVVKLGLEYSSKTSWRECSDLTEEYGMSWVADAKLHDIPNTVAAAVNNLAELPNKPFGITIHTKTGVDSLKAAQAVANEADITLFGVSHLTSISEDETLAYEKALPRVVVWREARRAVNAENGGLVCAAPEVRMIKRFQKTKGLLTMIPGTRSVGVNTADQKRTTTPFEAVRAGADLLVIGRQISGADDPAEAYADLVKEISSAIELREAA